MVAELVGLIVAWIVAILSNFKDLFPKKFKTRGIAAVIVVVVTGFTVYSLAAVVENHSRKEIGHMPERTARYLQEASGATLWRYRGTSAVLVVDDEVPAIIQLLPVGRDDFVYERHHWLRENGGQLKDVKDLEGLAASIDGRFIYAVTSHSYAMDSDDDEKKRAIKKARRSYAIRGCIPDPGANEFIVLDRVPLTEAFEAAILDGKTAAPFQIPFREESGVSDGKMLVSMEIEALAADDEGYLYFGFRAPLNLNGRAIVAKIPAENLFPGQPPCTERSVPETRLDPRAVEVLGIPLHVKDVGYGIVSMEFDPATRDLIIITNSPNPFEGLRPRACHWHPRPGRLPSCRFLPDTREPYWGKQEALVLGPSGDKATVFIDGDKGLGGWVTYDRDELGP